MDRYKILCSSGTPRKEASLCQNELDYLISEVLRINMKHAQKYPGSITRSDEAKIHTNIESPKAGAQVKIKNFLFK